MTLSIEYIIVGIAWVTTALALWRCVPRDKHNLRKAQVIFLFTQSVTWFFGLMVSEWGLITYPVHEFEHVANTSFTFEFFVYPSICVVYNLYFPEAQSYMGKFLYTAAYTTPITVLEVLFEKYTALIKYIHWAWYWTWITIFLTFCLSRAYNKWFYNDYSAKKQP